jgi:DNA-binding beta-propeller fold protein YncE
VKRGWRLHWALLLACWLGLSGCAETKYQMRLEPEPRAGAVAQVWPAAPETPRYRYVGQLFGAQNFVPAEGEGPSTAMKVLTFLLGVFDGYQEKTVLKRPQSGMTDADGRVYVTDVGAHAVFVFDPSGKLTLWNFAAKGVHFVTPIGIAAGANGDILVVDAELGQVFRFDPAGTPLGSFGHNLLTRPTGIARDAKRGLIYVSDTHAHDVKVFDDAGSLVDTISSHGEDEDGLNFPTHLAFAGDRLYVTDGMNARIQIFDTQGKLVDTLGKRGIMIGQMTRPKGVTVDAEGNIYVVESYFDSLLVFNSAKAFLMAIGGTGQEIGQFYLPAGVWSDQRGRIYVADMFNGRVVIFQFLGG